MFLGFGSVKHAELTARKEHRVQADVFFVKLPEGDVVF
jgi:hypothetical protein